MTQCCEPGCIKKALLGAFKCLECGQEQVDHPDHYGGVDNPYEVIKVLEAWLTPEELRGFCKGSAIKYLARAGKKEGQPANRDVEKAAWYLKYIADRVEDA